MSSVRTIQPRSDNRPTSISFNERVRERLYTKGESISSVVTSSPSSSATLPRNMIPTRSAPKILRHHNKQQKSRTLDTGMSILRGPIGVLKRTSTQNHGHTRAKPSRNMCPYASQQRTTKQMLPTQAEVDAITTTNTKANARTNADTMIRMYHEFESSTQTPSLSFLHDNFKAEHDSVVRTSEPDADVSTLTLTPSKKTPSKKTIINTLPLPNTKAISQLGVVKTNTATNHISSNRRDTGNSVVVDDSSSRLGAWIVERLGSHHVGHQLVIGRRALTCLMRFVEHFCRGMVRAVRHQIKSDGAGASRITAGVFDAALMALFTNENNHTTAEMTRILETVPSVPSTESLPLSMAPTAYSRRMLGHWLDVALLAHIRPKVSQTRDVHGVSMDVTTVALKHFRQRVVHNLGKDNAESILSPP